MPFCETGVRQAHIFHGKFRISHASHAVFPELFLRNLHNSQIIPKISRAVRGVHLAEDCPSLHTIYCRQLS
jgi:hypothetical protein